jgi:hypothetical protein
MEKTQINLDEEFIPYKQALALKELGFNEPCFGLFNNIEPNELYELHSTSTNTGKLILAPLYQQAFRWFRKNHKLQPSVNSFCFEEYSFNILGSKNEILYPLYNKILNDGKKNSWEFDTYEEAELECLKKLIEIVKTK